MKEEKKENDKIEKNYGISKLHSSVSPEVAKVVLKSESNYATTGAILGFIVIIVGFVACYLSFTGNAAWTIEVPGLKSEVANASPGIFLMVVGVVIIFVTRLKINIK